MHEVETMAFFGKVPWHGLGTQVNESATRNVAEFITEAGLDWTVAKASLRYGPLVGTSDPHWQGFEGDAPHTGRIVHDEYHLIRTSDGAQLSEIPVTEYNYNIRQNSDMFEIFEPFLEDGTMTLNTGGSLFNGRRVWVLAQLTTGFSLPGDDTVNNFMLFTVEHSGKHANTAFYTPVRVVCNNTLRQAKAGAENTIKDSHRSPFDVNLMRDALTIVRRQSVDFEEFASAMANTHLSADQQRTFFRKVYDMEELKELDSGRLVDHAPVLRAMELLNGVETRTPVASLTKDQKLKDSEDRARQLMEAIQDTVRTGGAFDMDSLPVDTITANEPDLSINPGWDKISSSGTLWGAYNVATYVEDHAPMKKRKSPDHRAQRALWGSIQGRDLKTRAVDVARELLAA